MTDQMTAKDQFLDYIAKHKSKATTKNYRVGFRKFEAWLGKSSDEILEMRRRDAQSTDPMKLRRFHELIEQFHKELIEKEGKSHNTARTICNGATQFFAYWCLPVNISFTIETTRKTAVPEANDYRKMYALADLRSKLMLSLGLDLAWRVNDVTSLRKADIPDLSQECPIQIEKITSKEREFSSTFISCETVQLLKSYMKTLKEDNEFLFQANGSLHADSENLNGTIQRLGFQSGFCDEKGKVLNGRNRGKNFTWHSFRKSFLTVATQLGVESDQKCLLVGKAIEKGQSMETYIDDPKLKNAFLAIRNALSLTKTQVVEMKNGEIEDLKAQIVQLSIEAHGKDTEIKTLRERIIDLEFTQGTHHKMLTDMEDDMNTVKRILKIKEKFRPD